MKVNKISNRFNIMIIITNIFVDLDYVYEGSNVAYS